MYDWDTLERECKECNRCGLATSRTNIVIGRGSRNAPVMLVGEGPGKQEDLQGLPFVGQAGKLLDLLLSALMFNSDDYYIANIVKCRPPGNRAPTDEEAYACLPFLRNQVKLVRPEIIVCMGVTASKYIIDRNIQLTAERGVWRQSKGYWLMPTFHPAALLRDPSKKVLMFDDLKLVREKLKEIMAGNNRINA
jgi:DNA polymerase